jgi:hypothetical protein
MLGQREAEHPARAHVQHRGEMELALICADLGAIAVPFLVDLPGGKVPLD